MNKIYICSLKFAPGLFKEFTLLGAKFIENNSDVNYLVSNGYKSFFKVNNNVNYITNSKNSKEMIIDFFLFPIYFFKLFKIINSNRNSKMQFLFYNPHPLNPVLQYFIKFISNAKVITVLHEPYKTKKERLEYGFGGYVFFSIVNIFQVMSIRISDKIITMSPYGKELFLKYFNKYSDKLITSNLLLPNISYNKKERKYFSFIGRVNKGKGIQDFIDTINYCIKYKISKYNFLIITATNIDEYINNLDKGWESILTVINHQNITDDEINSVITKSKAVLILHQTASQSGVLPLSCQLKTPIIARGLTAFSQYFDNSGVVLGKQFQAKELISACENIGNNFELYSNNSYKIYKNTFSENNFEKDYKELLN